TATEWLSDRFVVQFSADGTAWKDAVTLKAAGKSRQPLDYECLVKNAAGFSYFRLLQFDLDGNSTAYEILHRDCTGEGDNDYFRLFPNPATSALNIDVRQGSAANPSRLTIKDNLGRHMQSIELQ